MRFISAERWQANMLLFLDSVMIRAARRYDYTVSMMALRTNVSERCNRSLHVELYLLIYTRGLAVLYGPTAFAPVVLR